MHFQARKAVFIGSFVLAVCACAGPSKADLDSLKVENQALRGELEELKNGEPRLIAEIDNAYKAHDFAHARSEIEVLKLKHPESAANARFETMLADMSQQDLANQQRVAAAQEEQRKAAMVSDTGMWKVAHYVDAFGASTSTKFIMNAKHVHGTFSNTATQDSPLLVDFLIDGADRIALQLYEYAGHNPVKAVSREHYWVRIRDKDNQDYSLSATNGSDRLDFDKETSRKVNAILLKGGSIRFVITDQDRGASEYHFTLDEAGLYDHALGQLTASN